MLNLNSIKWIFGIILFSMFIPACTDLETELEDSIPVADDGGSTGVAGELLTSAYNRLGDHIPQDGIMALLEHPTDEMMGPTRGTDWGDNGIWRTLHQHTWDPTHAYILRSWNNLNAAVFICNQVLGASPSAQQTAEAKFLRAFNMFYILDLFGVVPFREVDEGVEVNPRVLNSTEAFDFIIKDLTEALPNLVEGGPLTNPAVANKAAANTLLAKMYLNKAVFLSANRTEPFNFTAEDMNKVIAYCDAVTEAGYELEDDYFESFIEDPRVTEQKTERIFITDKKITTQPNHYYFMGTHYNQPPAGQSSGGWNGFTTLSDFYQLYDEGDERLGSNPAHGFGFNVGPQTDAAGNPVMNRRGSQLNYTPDVQIAGNDDEAGIRVIKYYPEVINNGTPDDTSDDIETIGSLVLFRYADVYLMKIEALLRGGDPTMGQTAQGMLDNLRTLRGADPVSATIDVILDERGRELYYERVRRTDQIRFGTYTSTWQEKSITDPNRILFPIPQQALDSNPNLEQNPGY